MGARPGVTPLASAGPPLPGARHFLVDAGGVRLHVAELGPEDGEPLLLVHGWPQHWWCWRRVASRLPDRRLLMVDLRGHGWSEAPRSGYAKEQLAADLLGLLDALGIDSVRYVGHDWGAWVGMLLAMREPQRVRSLLACSIVHPWPSWNDRLNPRRLLGFAYQLPLSTPLLGAAMMRAGLTRQILRRAAPPGAFSERDLRAFDARMGSPTGARVTTAMYRTFALRELPAIAAGRYRDARLEVPTKLIVGTREPIAQHADLRGYERNAPRMEIEWVPGAGHFLPDERPELVAARIRAK